MPGPQPLATKNQDLSPAMSDLGLGDDLTNSVNEMLNQWKKKLLNANGNQTQGMTIGSQQFGSVFSPAIQSLGLGNGYGG